MMIFIAIIPLGSACKKGNTDNIVDTGWRLSLIYDVPLEIMNPIPTFYEMPRPVACFQEWSVDFRVGKKGNDGNYDWESTVATSFNEVQGLPVQGWDNPDRNDWSDCEGCSNEYALEHPVLLFDLDYNPTPFPSNLTPLIDPRLDFSLDTGGYFLVSLLFPFTDVYDISENSPGCITSCDHTVYDSYNIPPGPPIHYKIPQEARSGCSPLGWIFMITSLDQVVTTQYENGYLTIQLRCIENCENINCTNGCDDGNSCTRDECVTGQGCVYEPIAGGTCQDNQCFTPGVCNEGTCTGGDLIVCDDGNECTHDFCTPEYGCVHPEDNKVLSNEVPDDCVVSGCFEGQRWDDLPAFEVPPQVSPTDCEIQFCSDGQVLTTDYFDETGCQE